MLGGQQRSGSVGDFDLDDSAIALAVPPRISMVEPCCPVCDIVEQSSDVFRRTNVLEGHTQKFSSGVAIVVYSGVIDGEKRESIKIVDPHGLGVVVEQQAVAGFRAGCVSGAGVLSPAATAWLCCAMACSSRLACVYRRTRKMRQSVSMIEGIYGTSTCPAVMWPRSMTSAKLRVPTTAGGTGCSGGRATANLRTSSPSHGRTH